MNRRIGIIDADLLDGGTRHPNLVCLKLAGYYNNVLGDKAELIEDYKELDSGGAKEYDHIFLARVFDFTSIPDGVLLYPNLTWGGKLDSKKGLRSSRVVQSALIPLKNLDLCGRSRMKWNMLCQTIICMIRISSIK